jgi:hypothetical protein
VLIFQALFELAVFGLLLGNGLEGASDDRHPEAKKSSYSQALLETD